MVDSSTAAPGYSLTINNIDKNGWLWVVGGWIQCLYGASTQKLETFIPLNFADNTNRICTYCRMNKDLSGWNPTIKIELHYESPNTSHFAPLSGNSYNYLITYRYTLNN